MIDYLALATEALNNEGADAFGGRTPEQLAEALEAGHAAGTVTITDDTSFTIHSLPALETHTVATLAAQLNVTTEDLQALIDGSHIDTDEIFVDSFAQDALTPEAVEILTDAVKALA